MKIICNFIALLIWAQTAMAAPSVPAYTMTNSLAASLYADYTFGSKFTVVSPCQLEKLGVYDHNQDGLAASAPVGLWNSAGTLLAQTTVTNSDPLTGVFRFHALASPVTLVAGQTYYIGALANNVDETAEDGPNFTENALIHFDSARFVEGATLSRPVEDGGTDPKYFGANMIISALPNAVPTDIVVTPNNINENNAPGATVGTLAATGPNAGTSQSFAFVSGAGSADNGAFTITGSTLSINASADFETKSSYSIRVQSTDTTNPSLVFEKAIVIAINDVVIPQSIVFVPIPNKTFGNAPFTISATGGASGQPVTFSVSGPATLSGLTVTLTGAGTVIITASQAGAGDYAAAPSEDRTFTVAKASQTINFTQPTAHTFGDAPFPLVATGGGSGNPVTFTVTSGPATVSGNTLTITGAGSVSVRASQAGNADYNAALNVTRTFAVAQAAQTISFTNPGPRTFGDAPFALLATGGGSGNPVTFAVTAGPATVSGNTLTITGAGSVTVRASQAGNVNYSAAVDVDQTFSVAKASQTISFGALGAKTFGDAPFTVSATGGASGNPVTFTASGNATVTGNTVTITGAGSATISAHQAGSADYEAAPDVPQTFTIAQASQTISFAPLPPRNFGDAPFTVSATGGGSGNPVTFSIESGPATIAGNTVTLTGSGSVTVRASQAGNVDYSAAADVDQTFAVSEASQVITFGPLANKNFGEAPFTVSATGGASGEPVTFTATGPVTIVGNLVTITGTGSVTITAHQAGAGSYTAAADVSQSFTVAKGVQVITFAPQALAGSNDTITVTATGGTSGNPVTIALISGPAILAGNSLQFTGVGAVLLRASQAGNANYDPAVDVDATINVVLNRAPVGADDAVATTTGEATLYPLANDVDPDGSILTITAVSEPSVVIDGRALVIPTGYTGTFSYTLSDGISSDTADVVVTAIPTVVGVKRFTGLLYNSTGKIVGRAVMSRSATGVNIFSLRIGSTSGIQVFTGTSITGLSTAAGLVDVSLGLDNRVTVSMATGVNGNLRPSVNSATATRHNVAVDAVNPGIPGGGFGKVTITSGGLARLAIKMPDGRGLLAQSDVCDNGSITFYARQNVSAPAAFVGGEFILANLTKTDITGEMEWVKPPQATGLNRAGVNTVVVLNGCVNTGVFGIPDGPAVVTLSGGNFPSPVTINSTIVAGRVTPVLPTIVGWSAQTLGPTFRNTTMQPGFVRPTLGTGIFFPKSQTAVGFFRGTTLGGKIEVHVP